jgi:hypothetical protein
VGDRWTASLGKDLSRNLKKSIRKIFELKHQSSPLITRQILTLSKTSQSSSSKSLLLTLPRDSLLLGFITYRFLNFEVKIGAVSIHSQIGSSRKLEHYKKSREAMKTIRDQMSVLLLLLPTEY